MILQALHRLAENEKLVPDLDFEMKPVAWTVVLKPNGELVEIKSRRRNLNEGTKRKAKWVGLPMFVPRQRYRSGIKAIPYFLCDNPKFVFGVNIGKDPISDDSSRAANERFFGLIQECNDTLKDSKVEAVIQFLETLDATTLNLPEDLRSNDLLCFEIGLGDPVHADSLVRTWWKKRCRECQPNGGEFQCLVTGKRFGVIEQFPQIGPVPGAAKPIKLVSFNRSAFRSHRLKANENAPISDSAGILVATALNRLLHSAYPSPHDLDRSLPRRNVGITSDTLGCYWASSPAPQVTGMLDAIPDLFDCENEETVGELYRSIWNGKPVQIKDPSAFYVLILSGAQGRAVVRDWIETTLDGANRHLAEHFKDLSIVRNARPKKGAKLPPTIPLKRLAESIAAEGKSENIPSSLEAGFLRSAFTGIPYPFQLLQRALVRTRAEAGKRTQDKKKIFEREVRRDSRAAIIRAVLNRRRRFDPQAHERYPEVPVSMNPNLESPGYSLGILMAVLERLQQLALGDVNATVVDRYFGAASAAPRTVFVRLLKSSRHHAEKAASADDGKNRFLAQRLDRIIDFLCSRFELSRKQYPPASQGIPAHLDLEQQGLFVLGYHQMRHWLWMNKEERDEWEREQGDLPRAFSFRKANAAEPTSA